MSDRSGTLAIEVAYAEPEEQWVIPVTVPVGATVADALNRVAGQEPFCRLPLNAMPVGIFGDVVGRDQALTHEDRVELYRPLQVDPKEARRQRALADRG